jgi:gag-polyprotein putative aspartyl protease/Aspartyl protease
MKLVFVIFCVIGLMVASPSCAQNKAKQSNVQFEIPFTMDRNLVIIKGKLGNEEADFIFDTGTKGIVISDEVAQKQRFKKSGTAKMGSPNSPTMEELPTVIIPKLDFNGLILNKTNAVAVNPQNIFSPTAVGIVGMSAFEGNLITIDYKNAKLIFKKGQLTPNKNTIEIDPTMILEGKISLNGKQVLAHFDCGSPNFIAIPKEWTADYKLKSEPKLMGKGMTPGGQFEVYIADFDGDIAIGSLVLNNPKVELLTGNFPAVNLGFRFFSKYLITIDTKNKLMQILPNS